MLDAAALAVVLQELGLLLACTLRLAHRLVSRDTEVSRPLALADAPGVQGQLAQVARGKTTWRRPLVAAFRRDGMATVCPAGQVTVRALNSSFENNPARLDAGGTGAVSFISGASLASASRTELPP